MSMHADVDAQLAALEAKLKSLQEQKALKRIAHRKKFGTDLPAYTANADVDYDHGTYHYSDNSGSLYIGARVRVRNYGGTAEITSIYPSGLTNRRGEPVYKVDVVFNVPGGPADPKARLNEVWASHCTNIQHTPPEPKASIADMPLCEFDSVDEMKAALAALKAEVVQLTGQELEQA